jgi:hypothetical protein
MANLTKTYYISPNWDVPPGGPLSLGSVLSSTKRPLPPLLICPVTDVPHSTTPSTSGAAPVQPQLFSTTKYNVSYTTSTLCSGFVSLFASFVAPVLGVGPDASTKLSRDCALTLRFARVDTQEWYPSTAELQKLVEHPSISRFLERLRAWNAKYLFVVTGVKVAYGARAESKNACEIKSELHVSLNPGVAVGVPGAIEFGPGAGLGKKQSTEVGWETGAGGKEDPGFVFAYKVQRVKVKKKNGEVIDVTSKDYTRGALYEEVISIADTPEEYEIDTMNEEDDTKEEGVLVEAGDGDENLLLIPP